MLVDTYFARQPIFDRGRRLAGFELLYRPGPRRTSVDPVAATAHVMASAFSDLESETPDANTGVPSFVNLPRSLIVSRAAYAFPPRLFAVEVLEDVTPDDEVIEALAELRAAGYRVALDDFVHEDHRWPLVPFVDVVKVDVMAVPQGRLSGLVQKLDSSEAALLAEKVEEVTVFERCHSLGFDLFQGFFFAKPQLVAGRRVDGGRAHMAGLLGELHRPDATMDDIAAAVERHVDFAHQLLRVINSAAVGLPRQVDSIRQAVVMLGRRRTTELATVLALASNPHKPKELLGVALTRGRMCATVAQLMGRPDPHSFFTVGALSVLDALLDRALDEVVNPLPLSDELKHALIDHTGVKGEVLDATLAYERADFVQVERFDLDAGCWSQGYLEALEWSNEVMALV